SLQQRMGAVRLQGAGWILPETPETAELFQWLVQEIQSVRGEATLLRVDRIETMTDDEIAALFHKARAPEYHAVIQGCREILRHLDRYQKSRPYGMAVNSKGTVFYVAFGINKVGSVDPKTLEIREYTLPDPASRPRRIAITSDDIVWYSDFSRGYLGRLDPATGKVTEWQSPSGPKSQPSGISAIA